MCLRIVERYAVCKCVYFVHGVDQCNSYGMRGHIVTDKIVLVGHSCRDHSYSISSNSSQSSSINNSPAGSGVYVGSGIQYNGQGGIGGQLRQHQAYLEQLQRQAASGAHQAQYYSYNGNGYSR
ncbi:hypothetical protein BDZ91DRAFT_410212 [Kalaharituber pfeilii]|nr:hypothetical protein BDZ91DRAFT_410212 [Kalaharituber pfeilii]